jgi:hypothetical protein
VGGLTAYTYPVRKFVIQMIYERSVRLGILGVWNRPRVIASNKTMLVPRQARDVRIEETPLETCQYYPVGERAKALKSHPTKG